MANSWNMTSVVAALQEENKTNGRAETVEVSKVTNGTAHDPAGAVGTDWIKPQAYDYAAMESIISTQEWEGSARVYQWQDDFGDVGPEFPDMERELFGDPESRHEKAGVNFAK